LRENEGTELGSFLRSLLPAATGIEGKRLLWLALGQIRDVDRRLLELDFDQLPERARSQRERLEPHRLAAASIALA
jgi:hypothetical protein